LDPNPYRDLPSVESLLTRPGLAALDHHVAVAIAREAIESARAGISNGRRFDPSDVASEVTARIEALSGGPLRPLLNATGVILHTNLGRAPLAAEAIAAMEDVSRGYSNLEYDITTGRRGSRHSLLEPLLCRLTGAEAAMAVNNNAAAVLLALSALAPGREVIISRGQLVEIGGGFRIPDVMRQSRAKLVEVGSTNRTRLRDYAAAITERTAAIMRVHASNFRIVGFTESANIGELGQLAGERGLLLVDDLGSGCLLDTTRYGLPHEPTPRESIVAGATVVMFSGDKLLGGPQGGLVAGRRAAIDRMKRHPLARAVRLDKASIAGLAATLRIYAEGRAIEAIPAWRMITAPLEEIARRAEATAASIDGATVRDVRSMIGGGSLPEEGVPSRAVVLPGRVASRVAAALRMRGVVGRIEGGSVLLDPRTIDPADDAAVVEASVAALAIG
jgi:L-seryl-tRNA(Ser) seleniumtransferase